VRGDEVGILAGSGEGGWRMGRRFHWKGTKWAGSRGPIGTRGTTTPLDSNQRVRSVPGCSPMLTPSSVTGTKEKGTPVAFARVRRLSSGWRTIALRPNGIGGRWGLKPKRASFGVRGAEALQIELLSVSPTL